MSRLAFYAPLKSPHHRVPSGDREMARGILAALKMNSLGLEVELASEFRCFDGQGDKLTQNQLLQLAAVESERLIEHGKREKFSAWITYHNYYKAPDLIGPRVCRALKLPLIIIEASIAKHRLQGAWSTFAAAADAATEQADMLLYVTDRDRPALEQHRPPDQQVLRFPPFLNRTAVSKPFDTARPGHCLLAVGMHRNDVKLESYRMIADLLPMLEVADWRLRVVGDGPAHQQVRSMFESFADRVEFLGQVESNLMTEIYRQANLFIWPGINEAFGMVYLEAQAAGVPVIAQNRLGVREVVASPHSLVPTGNTQLLARQIDKVLTSAQLQTEMSRTGLEFVRNGHLLGSAASRLSGHLESLLDR